MQYYKVTLLVLETNYIIAGIFKIEAVVLNPKPSYTFTGLNLSPQSNISDFYGHNWGNI